MIQSTCLLTAAEPSGDALAAGMLEELHIRHPTWAWLGCQGPMMAAVASADHEAVARVSDLSAAGFIEVIPRLPALIAARRQLRAVLEDGPKVAIFVDAPDFHLPLAAQARALGVPTVLVVPPQWWAWRPRRLDSIQLHADLVLCLFAFEVNPLRARGVAAHWIGHPAATLFNKERPTSSNEARPLRIALLPGSRPSEVRRSLSAMCAGVDLALRRTARTARIEVPWRLPTSPPVIAGVEFLRGTGPEILHRADIAVVAAGTATLEAAALGVPNIITATAHPLTAAIARPLLKDQPLGLPNILLKGRVIPELHQNLAPHRIAALIEPLIAEPKAAQQRADAIRQRLRPLLGEPGFAARAAGFIEPLVAGNV